MPDTILVQGYHSLIPLIEALEADGRYQVALFENHDPDRLRQSLEMKPYMVEGQNVSRIVCHDLFTRFREFYKDPQFQAQFQFEGVSYFPAMEEAFWERVQHSMANSISVIEGFRRFWLDHRPRLVVLVNDVMLHTKALTRAAQQLRVPVLHVTHGSPPVSLFREIYADRAALYGQRDHDFYLSFGNPKEKLVKTGACIYDYCPTFYDTFDRSQALQDLGLPEAGRKVLFLATWANSLSARSNWKHVVDSFRSTLRACKNFPDTLVIVKPHPATFDSGAWFHKRAQEEETTCRVVEGKLSQMIAVSDVVLCYDSNAGVEAMILDRPVITLRFPPWESRLFEPEDGALVATNDAELAEALRGALEDPAVQAELRDKRRNHSVPRFNHGNDGKASQRILALIDQMVEAWRSQEPTLTLAVHTHNQLDSLRACVAAWPEATILVVDQGSTDGTREWLDETGGGWIPAPVHSADLWEALWAESKTEWVLYSAGPIEPIDGHWAFLRARFDDPEVSAVSPQLVSNEGWEGIGSFWAGEWQPFGDRLPVDSALAKRPWSLGGVPGGVVLRRRGQKGHKQIYCPSLQVKAVGWTPDRRPVQEGRAVAPFPIW